MGTISEYHLIGDIRISVELYVGVDTSAPLQERVAAKRSLRSAVNRAMPEIKKSLEERAVLTHTVAINIEVVEELP